VALGLSLLSPAASLPDQRPEALSAPRIIRPFVSLLEPSSYKTATSGDAQVRKVAEAEKVCIWSSIRSA